MRVQSVLAQRVSVPDKIGIAGRTPGHRGNRPRKGCAPPLESLRRSDRTDNPIHPTFRDDSKGCSVRGEENRSTTKTEIVIFLTPHIINGDVHADPEKYINTTSTLKADKTYSDPLPRDESTVPVP